MKKKNILLLHSSAEMYGSDIALLNILKGIDKTKYNLFVILPYDGVLVSKLKELDINIFITNVAVIRRKNLNIKGLMKYISDFIDSYRYLKKFIKDNNINLIYTNTSTIFVGAVAAKKCKIKNVWQVREIINKRSENYIISKIINRYADVVIANSKSTASSLNVDSNKIKIIYDAIDTKGYKKVKIKKEVSVIGMAGRINRVKGQKLFVDAAERIHRKYPDIIFKIAGNAYIGEEYMENDLKKYIKEKKLSRKIKLLGQVNDMNNFYSDIDIFVSPSIKPESFGLVILEAMMCGIPVVATNHGGPTEIIINDETGYLVDINTEQMADKLIKLIEDKELRNSFSKNGYSYVKDKFSLKKMIGELESVFDKYL